MKKLLSAVAIVIMTVALNSGCAASLPGIGNCALTADNAHLSTRAPGYIDGKGKVNCVYGSGSLTNLKIETKLQRLTSVGWSDVSGTLNPTTVSRAKSGVTYTGVSGFLLCSRGVYRTAARAEGYLDGRYSGMSSWEVSNSTNITC